MGVCYVYSRFLHAGGFVIMKYWCEGPWSLDPAPTIRF
jgi:hypothetical protein